MQKQEEGIIVADEGFGSLDVENLKKVFNLFKDLPFQLVCILHRINDVPKEVNTINLGGIDG